MEVSLRVRGLASSAGPFISSSFPHFSPLHPFLSPSLVSVLPARSRSRFSLSHTQPPNTHLPHIPFFYRSRSLFLFLSLSISFCHTHLSHIPFFYRPRSRCLFLFLSLCIFAFPLSPLPPRPFFPRLSSGQPPHLPSLSQALRKVFAAQCGTDAETLSRFTQRMAEAAAARTAVSRRTTQPPIPYHPPTQFRTTHHPTSSHSIPASSHL